jgi:hypothetical protein
MYICFFIIFFPGIFFIYNNFLYSSLVNTTFTNITSDDRCGGAIHINTPNYSSFTISHCVFALCKARSGGGVCLFSTPYIYITHTRFENNSADYSGDDIFTDNSDCFNSVESNALGSSVCSTTPLGNRVYCNGNENQLQNSCLDEIVRVIFFFFFSFYYIKPSFYFILLLLLSKRGKERRKNRKKRGKNQVKEKKEKEEEGRKRKGEERKKKFSFFFFVLFYLRNIFFL